MDTERRLGNSANPQNLEDTHTREPCGQNHPQCSDFATRLFEASGMLPRPREDSPFMINLSASLDPLLQRIIFNSTASLCFGWLRASEQLLGARVSEQLHNQDLSRGSSSNFHHICAIAKPMHNKGTYQLESENALNR